jgi:predicted RNA methylase
VNSTILKEEGGFMTKTMREQIIAELDTLPDQKVPSLLDYLHFLRQESEYIPNQKTINAIEQGERERKKIKSFSSVNEMFNDMGIDG